MKQKRLSNLEEFNSWKAEQIQEYSGSYTPAAKETNRIISPASFPVVVVFDDFEDADDGLFFFYEYVYPFN